jgi:tRNA 2-thiouridine synthesizing protein A
MTHEGIGVDATGLRCPLPVIRLAAAAKTAPDGTIVTLISTDPAAEPDVAAWCRMRGHELLEQNWLAGEPRTLRSRVRVAEAGEADRLAAPPPAGADTPPG